MTRDEILWLVEYHNRANGKIFEAGAQLTDEELRRANEAMDAALQKAGSSQTKYLHIETDHAFSAKRIALQTAVLEWLAGL